MSDVWMNFSRFLDIQSWWEVPSIAYFCSLFRSAFNLLDFDIEELEEALLTDGTEESSASSLLTELIVRLLKGCLGNNDISAFNYQMYLRRLFRRKCQTTGRYNPFNTDIDFQFLPLRTKVEIVYALCDFRLDAEDVFDIFKNLEAESLRVDPLGWDDNDSAYWYFYGTRLYREDIVRKTKGKHKKKRNRECRKRSWFHGDDTHNNDDKERIWQVVCFTEADWNQLTEKFSKASSKIEKELYRSLSQNFLPEIPRLFQEKERLQRKRLLELAPRRTSVRVLEKIKQKEEDIKSVSSDVKEEEEDSQDRHKKARDNRVKRRNFLRTYSSSSSSSEDEKVMPQKMKKPTKSQAKKPKNSTATIKDEPPPEPPVKHGRKTNNSLASATGQILISDNEEPTNSTRKKLKTSQIFCQNQEDVQTDMYKVLEQLTNHDDAWPFLDPVEEEYAPNYYAVIRRPMDLHKMEERLDKGFYLDFGMFQTDFRLIVNNCRLYNGQDNEYTIMVDNLSIAFERLTGKYMQTISSSDEEIAVEYPLPTPPRKHKLKSTESQSTPKRKKSKSNSETGEASSSTSMENPDVKEEEENEDEDNVSEIKESRKKKDGKKIKKKRKGHHHHGKHSKNHKKNQHKSRDSKRKKKHLKEGKKKEKKKRNKKSSETVTEEPLKRSTSQESLESSNRSRSASPLPSIHTPSPSQSEAEQASSSDFSKDKYDKIKERRRNAAKDAWESLFDYKQKAVDKRKQNVHVPEKEKNQKLRETIEKLKAKNENYKNKALFNNIFPSTSTANLDKGNSDSNQTQESASRDNDDSSDDDDDDSDFEDPKIKDKKLKRKKVKRKNAAKNESASEALEQAARDISKLLDDAPGGSNMSSPEGSPVQTYVTEDHENSRLDDDSSQSEKGILGKRELLRKRPSSREPKVIKRREIQRTIDRLQPGKSKGNLLTNVVITQKLEEVAPLGSQNKGRDNKPEESSPKLSLGSVLPTVEFSMGTDHNFSKNDEKLDTAIENTTEVVKAVSQSEDKKIIEKEPEKITIEEKKVDDKVEKAPETIIKSCQEKATPNLSAWFKAFGAPKNNVTTTSTKKKVDEHEHDEKSVDTAVTAVEPKTNSPKNIAKFDCPTDEASVNPDGGDSPLPNVSNTPRQRRTSTGSSVSERSSFSQDLDSPRHQMSHNSPLLRSPASPRTDDFQKITYPIINGTVRAGFYQDTTSVKSSPDKSCSPRECPQSPYSPYSQHVYASNNAMHSSNPNYFVDQNKSPLPTYGQIQPPPYYDTSKAPVVSKPVRGHDDYISLGPDSFQRNQYNENYMSSPSPYIRDQEIPFAHAQVPIVTKTTDSPAPAHSTQIMTTHKNTFPVKKRTYTENDMTLTINKIGANVKEDSINSHNKDDFPKIVQSMTPMPPIDDLSITLSDRCDISKLQALREKNVAEYSEQHQSHIIDAREHVGFVSNGNVVDKKKENESNKISQMMMSKKDNIDMINMGYNNIENERRSSGDINDLEFMQSRDNIKSNVPTAHQSKGYELEAINLGINSHHPHQAQKPMRRSNTNMNILPQEKPNVDSSIQNISNYEMGGQNISNFSLNDIELANKKLYSCNPVSGTAGIDYGNWKLTNQMRKQDTLPSDYSTSYASSGSDKLKTDLNAASANPGNYNKNLQHQQYHHYNAPRSNVSRTQEIHQNLQSELRIPNPRGLPKNDTILPTSNIGEDLVVKHMDSNLKTQKSDKVQSHPLVSSLQYKPPYSSHSSLQLENLRNLQSIPQMLERYTNDERYLSSFAAGSSSLYHDKSFPVAQMFNKGAASEVHHASTASSIYSQPSDMSKDANVYKSSTNIQSPIDAKNKNKRKRTSDVKQSIPNQSYHSSSCTSDVLSSVKPNMIPGSAFNFGTSPNMSLSGGLYGENSGFSIEDFRNSTNQLMAANYMAAAVAHQRNATESNTEKIAKPAHQNAAHTPASSFPFISHSQVRSGYPFVSADSSSPIYQQYLQRHQEELLRQTGAQIMGLYPPGYPGTLGVRQPYDSRHSWI